MVIEEAWGELSSRFRFLRTDITWAGDDWTADVGKIIYASMLLHNLCKASLDPPFPLEDADYQFIGQDMVPDSKASYAPSLDGNATRDALALWAYDRYTLGPGGVLERR
jgi:hypothetical protein